MATELLTFQYADTALTLREGLDAFHAQLADYVEAKGFFLLHDICHVVSGLSSQLTDEALADLWTLMCTDMKFRDYMAYLKDPQVNQLLKDLSFTDLALGTAKALPVVPRIFRHKRRMLKPWRFYEGEKFLDRPISEIRSEFGITPVWA